MSVARGATVAFEKWAKLAQKYEPMGPPMPMDTLLSEAGTVLRFVEQRWEPSRAAGQTLPGLRNAPSKVALDKRIRTELEELISAVRHANNLYVRELKAREIFPHRACRVALNGLLHIKPVAKELRGVWPLKASAARSGQRGKLADAIVAAAKLVQRHKALFKDWPEQRTRGQVEEVAAAAARASEQHASIERSLLQRDRLLAALHERTAAVRVTARAVFRDHPAEVRRVTSVYERKRRANHRKRLAEKLG